MTNHLDDPQLDERLAALLSEGAPPKSDPVFRIKLLERRERQRFKRKAISLAVFAATITTCVWSAHRVGASLAEAAAVVLFCVSIAALLVYAPVVTHVLRASSRKPGPLQNT